MALSFAKKNDKAQFLEYMNKAIALDPEDAETYDFYGEVLMVFEEYEEAKKQLEKAKALDFTPTETYIKLGKCLLELGQYEEALKNLRIGRNLAAHRVQKEKKTEDGRRIFIEDPQTELIKEAEQLISKIKKVSKL